MPARYVPCGRRRADRGAAAVELALVLPLVLLLVCGIVDFGRILNMQITLSGAAREGARWVALGQGNPTTRVTLAVAGTMPAPAVAWTACPANPPPSSTANTTVTVTRTYSMLTPLNALSGLLGGALPGTITVTGTGVMRCGG
jgi:Flp pilus assembly protein TadG